MVGKMNRSTLTLTSRSLWSHQPRNSSKTFSERSMRSTKSSWRPSLITILS